MVFKKSAKMPYGHVAVVNEIVSDREVLIDHANWAPRRSSMRGKVALGVSVIDVSENNDWSEVRVWYDPAEEYGRTNKLYGFIYPSLEDDEMEITWNSPRVTPKKLASADDSVEK
jgi:hypothetical protein